MNFLLKSIPALVILFSFTNCANGRKLQEEPPVEIKQAYYTSGTGGVKGAASGFTLFLPTEGEVGVEMDSVYFRGRRTALQKESSEDKLYVASFKIPSREANAPEIIMHKDPRMEYGNPTPQILPDIPFELKPDEAMVQYTVKGQVKYFRVKGIKKRDSAAVPIKKPKKIQH